METLKKTSETKENKICQSEQDFTLDYQGIFSSSENAVVVKTEWTRNGDYFEKLSLYDNSYSTILTFGNTTLIK